MRADDVLNGMPIQHRIAIRLMLRHDRPGSPASFVVAGDRCTITREKARKLWAQFNRLLALRWQSERPPSGGDRMNRERGAGEVGVALGISVALLLLVLVFGASLWGCPQYNIYERKLAGEAELAQAESNRQIAVREAQAKLDASKLLAAAEVERAKGVAEANRIIGEGLKGHDEYLRYLWISNIDKVSGQIVYVPTEASLPILEATRGK